MFAVAEFQARTLSWWFTQRDNIDMSPSYQRSGGVWSKEDKAILIDSILNDFDIPKLYLANFSYGSTPLNEHNRQYAVIDGKQRLEAIFDFFDNRLTLLKDFQYQEEPRLRLAGLTYRDLKRRHPTVAAKFENYNLSVMSVVTDDESKVTELFLRLNRSKPLTGAEVRNAMRGIVPKLIRDVADHQFFKSRIRFSVKRGEHRNAAAKLLLLEFRGRFVDTKKVQLNRFVEEGVKAEARAVEFERAAKRVKATLNTMIEIFAPRDPLLSSQGPAILYYWLVRGYGDEYGDSIRGFLVEFERSRVTNRQLAKDPSVEPDAIDAELLRFDTLNRSTNDQGSLEGRYEILEERFLAY